MNFFFLRHTSLNIAKDIFYGQTDIDVSKNFNKELNLGDWEMKPKSKISRKLIKEWEENLIKFKIPNGESNQDFLKRLKKFLDEIKKYDQDVLIVSHAGSINGMMSILTGQPFDKLLKNYWEKIDYGSLSLVESEGNSFNIKYVGK